MHEPCALPGGNTRRRFAIMSECQFRKNFSKLANTPKRGSTNPQCRHVAEIRRSTDRTGYASACRTRQRNLWSATRGRMGRVRARMGRAAPDKAGGACRTRWASLERRRSDRFIIPQSETVSAPACAGVRSVPGQSAPSRRTVAATSHVPAAVPSRRGSKPETFPHGVSRRVPQYHMRRAIERPVDWVDRCDTQGVSGVAHEMLQAYALREV